MQIYYLTLLEVRRLQGASVDYIQDVGRDVLLLQTLGEDPFFDYSSFWRLPAFLGP